MWNWKLSVLIRCLPTHRLWWMYLMVTCLDEQEQRKQAWLMVNRQDGMGVKSLCLGFAIPDFQKCEGIQYLITDNMPKVSMTKCFCVLQYSANVRGVILVSPEVYGNRAGFIPLWPLLNSSLLSDSSFPNELSCRNNTFPDALVSWDEQELSRTVRREEALKSSAVDVIFCALSCLNGLAIFLFYPSYNNFFLSCMLAVVLIVLFLSWSYCLLILSLDAAISY